ncbi:MAG: hypothetical protein R2932_30555 [Caldilineaceae bacterium]
MNRTIIARLINIMLGIWLMARRLYSLTQRLPPPMIGLWVHWLLPVPRWRCGRPHACCVW